MRRIRKAFGGKSDKAAGKAPAVNEAGDSTDEDVEESAFGLEVLAEGVDPIVDIVAIHGLNGHREKTWTAKNGVNWLRDQKMLPAALPKARIMSWGYDANTHSTKPLAGMYLYEHGQSLISDLALYRQLDETKQRPIIFVAHSLGGILLKDALLHSDSTGANHLDHHRAIKISTYGIIFMGTPHQGGDGVDLGKRLAHIASIFVNTNQRLLDILKRDSEILQQQIARYNSISSHFDTKFAFETKPTSLKILPAMIIVPRSSAVVPGHVDAEAIAIMADHTKMVKFGSENASEYRKVAGHLKIMADKAPAKVRENWSTEGVIQALHASKLNPNFSVDFDLTGVPKTGAFIGRKSDLDMIEKYLKPDQVATRRNIYVIHGMGGMGKTQLAIEYARIHKKAYTSFFWLDGKTEESLIKSLLSVVSRLPNGKIANINLRQMKGLEESRKMAQKVLDWFAIRDNTQWLLVYDNIDRTSYEADEPHKSADSSTSYDITSYFPKGDSGSIIITTRLQRLVSLGSGLHLEKLSDVDGLLILEKHAGQTFRTVCEVASLADSTDISLWDPDAVLLVQRLGCLPLALVFAGSYISKTTIANYLKLYEKSWKDLHTTMKNRPDYPERTIITTWQISYDELKLKDKSAANLLCLWGYIDNQELWYELLTWDHHFDEYYGGDIWLQEKAPCWLRAVMKTEIEFQRTIDMLLGYSLIQRNQNSDSYTIHIVVHDWIRTTINADNNENLLQVAVTTIGLAVPDDDGVHFWTTHRRLLPHISRLLQDWPCTSEDWKLAEGVDACSYLVALINLGDCLLNQHRLVEADALYLRALRGSETTFGTESGLTQRAVSSYGIICEMDGRLAEAEALYKRALARREKIVGADHPRTLNIINNLGRLYGKQGRSTDAEAMYQRALAGKKRACGIESSSTLNAMCNIALLYMSQGRFAEAEDMCKQVLSVGEKIHGPDHPSMIDAVAILGGVYIECGRLVEAEPLLERVFNCKETLLGINHQHTLGAIYDLGLLYYKQDRFGEAELLFEQVVNGRKMLLGINHEHTLYAIHNLGAVYYEQDRLEEAEALLKQAVNGRKILLGINHEDTLDAIHNLGLVYYEQDRLEKAKALFEQTVNGRKTLLGIDHEDTLHAIHNLGLLYYKQDRLEEAEAYLKQALMGKENLLGLDHKSTLVAAELLFYIYEKEGKIEEANALRQRLSLDVEAAGHGDSARKVKSRAWRRRRRTWKTKVKFRSRAL